MAGVRLVWERVRWEVRQGQVVWMEFRIPAHVAVPGSLLQVKALCSHCGGAGGGSPELSCRKCHVCAKLYLRTEEECSRSGSVA